MKTNSWTRRAMLLLAALTALLSGCTTYVTTQVTAFSDWSGSDATRTYAFTREPEQRSNLELSTYERIVANEGTMPTHGALFVTLLIGVVLLVGLLNYVPALALGPVLEHLVLWK